MSIGTLLDSAHLWPLFLPLFFQVLLIFNGKPLVFHWFSFVTGPSENIFWTSFLRFGQNCTAFVRAPFGIKINTHILQTHTKNSLEADFRFSALNFFYSPVRLRKITKSHEIHAASPGFGQVSKRLDRFWVSGPLRPLETPNHHQTSSTCSNHEYYRFWTFEAIWHTLDTFFRCLPAVRLAVRLLFAMLFACRSPPSSQNSSKKSAGVPRSPPNFIHLFIPRVLSILSLWSNLAYSRYVFFHVFCDDRRRTARRTAGEQQGEQHGEQQANSTGFDAPG